MKNLMQSYNVQFFIPQLYKKFLPLNSNLQVTCILFERPRFKVKIKVSKNQSVFLKNCSTSSETLISLELHWTW